MRFPPDSGISRRRFIAGSLACTLVPARAAEATSRQSHLGPMVGHTESDRCVIWFRPATAGRFVLEYREGDGGPSRKVELESREADDFCLHWRLENLRPATSYIYRVFGSTGVELAAATFTTAPNVATASKVRIAISSCALEDEGSRAVWNRMAEEKVDGVILIGDTPYIDSTEMEVQTRRHQEFAAVEEYQKLLSSRPGWWTWDDHDFAGNDSSGLARGKENSRKVFCRYRPLWSFGEMEQGIHTSFRYGPVEVFLLDTRWFSMTEPSFANAVKPTVLGAAQWKWLQEGLKNSTASFKLIACGIIWDDKENSEADDWGSYPHERKALEKFIRDERISGVIYVGGDIHASRVLRYKTRKTAGYDLVQFIASPIHSRVIPGLNVYHPDLVRSAVEPHVFLLAEIDGTVTPPRFSAELVNRHGERVFTYQLTLDELTHA